MEADDACGRGGDGLEDPGRAVLAECPHKRDGRAGKEECERKERDDGAAEGGDATQSRGQAAASGRKKSKASGKMRLVRSMAVCEESPPACSPSDGPPHAAEEPPARVSRSPSAEEVEEEAASPRREVEEEAAAAHDHDDDDKAGCDDKAAKLLSRDSSQDYTDSTGIDVHEFLVNTLKSSPRDRIMLLKLEQELMDFIHDATQYKKFPQMTSYHRMLVHRVAAYFGMDHNVDQTGKAVVVNKTPSTRIPEQPFNEHFTEEVPATEIPKRATMKRDVDSVDADDWQQSSAPEYCLTEVRIQEPSPLSSTQKRRQMFRSHRDGSSGDGGGPGGSGSWQSSTETEYGGAGGTPPRRWGPRPWSSTDSESSHAAPVPRRPAVIKASSFSGISTVLLRGDVGAGGGGGPWADGGPPGNAGSESPCGQTSSTACVARARHGQQGPRRSPAAAPPPAAAAAAPSYCATATAAPVPAGPSGPSYCLLPLESMGIPPGSILVNPQTGQPFLNPDGSPAVYNPPTVQQPARGQLSELGQLILTTGHHQPLGNHHNHSHASLGHGQTASPTSVQHPYSQHMVAFTPPQQYSMDELGLQFGHVTLGHHSHSPGGGGGDITEPATAPYPPPMMQQSQHHVTYGMSLTAGAPPGTPNGYGGAASHPAAPPQQQQQQVYTLQQQQQQVPVFIYAQGQYGHVGQQPCRPATPVQYGGGGGGQRGQHGHSAQTHGFQGPPPAQQQQQQFHGVMSAHQAAPSCGQLAGDGGGGSGGHAQLQGMLLQYPAAPMMPSYQLPYHLQSTSHPQQQQHHQQHLQQHQHHHHQQQHQQAGASNHQHHGHHARGRPGDAACSDDLGAPSGGGGGTTVPLFCGLAPATAALGHGGTARAPPGPMQACLGAVGPGGGGGGGGGSEPVAAYSAVSLPGGCRANYTALCMPWTQLKY